MYDDELAELKTAHSSLTIAARMELNSILRNYIFESDSANKLFPENVKYLEALMNIVQEMIVDYNELPGRANVYHLPEMENNLNLLLPYTDPCVDLHDILMKCKLILEKQEEFDQDWTSKLSEESGRFSSECLKIQDLLRRNQQ